MTGRVVKCLDMVFLHSIECSMKQSKCICWNETKVGDTMLLLGSTNFSYQPGEMKIVLAIVPRIGLTTFYMHPNELHKFFEDV